MLQNIAIFLIATLSSLYISAILLRFLLALNRADFYNPVSQFLVAITQPILKPLRRFIPAIGKIDTSSLVLAFAVQFIAISLVYFLRGIGFPLPTIVIASIAELTRSLIWILFAAIFVRVLLSWIVNYSANPLASLLDDLTDPILVPIRKKMGLVGGFDLSPLIAGILLQIALIILSPLPNIY